MLYNAQSHYAAVVVNGVAGYLDSSAVTSAPLLLADGNVDIVYEYSTTENGTYTAFGGVVNAGTYYVRAYTDLADSTLATNYVAWSRTVELTILPVEFINESGHLGMLYLIANSVPYDTGTHYLGVSKTATAVDDLVSTLYYEDLGLTIPVTYTYSSAAFTGAVNAGTYAITATIAASTNYLGWTGTANLVVEKLTWTSREGHFGAHYLADVTTLYDMRTHYVGVKNSTQANDNDVPTLTFLGGNIVLTVNYTYNTTSASDPYATAFTGAVNAGTYYVKASITGTSNYDGWEDTAVLTIQQLQWTDTTGHLGALYFVGNTLTYDTTTHGCYLSRSNEWNNADNLTKSVVLAGGTLNFTVSYTYTYQEYLTDTPTASAAFSPVKNAGYYYVTASIASDAYGNYAAYSQTVLLTINKAAFGGGVLPALYFNGLTTKYDMLAHSIYVSTTDAYSTTAFTSVSLLTGDGTANIVYSYSLTEDGAKTTIATPSMTNAGTYYFRATVNLTGDNAVNYAAWSRDALLYIQKLEYIEGELGAWGLHSATMPFDTETHYMNVTTTGAYSDDAAIFDGYDVALAGGTLHVTIGYTYGTSEGTYPNAFTGAMHAGVYYVKATIAATANYDAFEATAVLVITRLQWNNTTGHLGNLYLVGGGLDFAYDAVNHYVTASRSSSGTATSLLTSVSQELPNHVTLTFTVNYKYYLGVAGSGNYDTTFTAANDAGNYNIRAYIEGGDGYDWDAWEATTTLTIEKLTWTADSDPLDPIYLVGGGLNITYDEARHYVGVAASAGSNSPQTNWSVTLTSGITQNFTVDYTYYMGALGSGNYGDEGNFEYAENAGVYQIKAAIAATTNWDAWEATTTITINKIEWTGANALYLLGGVDIAYDAVWHYVSVSRSSTGTPTSQLASVTVTGLTHVFDVTYTYYAGALGSGNYGDDGNFVRAKNAGEYHVKAAIAGSVNWDAWEDTTTVIIHKLTWAEDTDCLNPLDLLGSVDITFDNADHTVYISDGVSNSSGDWTVTLASGQTLEMTVSYKYYLGELGAGSYSADFTSAKNAGTYQIKASIEADANGNYDAWEDTATITIRKITWTGARALYLVGGGTIVFDGSYHYLAVDFDSTASATALTNPIELSLTGGNIDVPVSYKYYMGEYGSSTYTTTFESAYNAGIYNVQATIAESTNWVGWTAEDTLTINKIQWNGQAGNFDDLSLVGATFTYDTTTHYIGVSTDGNYNDTTVSTLSYTIGSAEFNNIPVTYTYFKGDSGEYTAAFTGATSAGVYHIKATIAESTNYEGFEDTAVITINKIQWNGTDHNFSKIAAINVNKTYDMLASYAAFNYLDEDDTLLGTINSQTATAYFYIAAASTSSFCAEADSNLSLPITWYYNTTGHGASATYPNVFTSAVNAGTYYVRVAMQGNDNVEGWTRDITITIDRLTWTDTTGHLGALYIKDSVTRYYDMHTHYVGVTRTSGAWVDSSVTELSVVLAGGTLNFTVNYNYNTTGHGVSATYPNAFTGALNAGAYYVEASIAAGDNYYGWTGTSTITINALTFADGTLAEGKLGALYFDMTGTDTDSDGFIDRTYDSVAHYIAVSKTAGWTDEYVTSLSYALSVEDTLVVPITYTMTYNTAAANYANGFKNAGKYVITATISDANGNYETKVFTKRVEIRKFVTSVVWSLPNNSTHLTYNGFTAAATATMQLTELEGLVTLSERVFLASALSTDYSGYTASNVFLTNETAITVDGSVTDTLTGLATTTLYHAGTYVVVALFDDTNYDVTNSNELVKIITIDKATIDKYLVGNTLTYDANRHYVKVSDTAAWLDEAVTSNTIALLGTDTATVVYTITTTDGTLISGVLNGAKNFGTYTISATITPAAAVVDDYYAWSNTATLRIDKRQLILTPTLNTETDCRTHTDLDVNGVCDVCGKTIPASACAIHKDDNFDGVCDVCGADVSWNKIYDRSTAYTTFTVSGWQGSDDTLAVMTAAYLNMNAGNNKNIQFTLSDREGVAAADSIVNNYTWNNVTGAYIFRKHLLLNTSLVWTKTYDGTTTAVPTLAGTPIVDLSTVLVSGYTICAGDEVTLGANYDSKNVNDVTKVVFSIIGSDNYYMDDIVQSNLIGVLDTSLVWYQTTIEYNGVNRENTSDNANTHVTLDLLGDDITTYGGSTLLVDLVYYQVLANDTVGAVVPYRNAGNYEIRVQDAHFTTSGSYCFLDGNYRIPLAQFTERCTINPKPATVEWQIVGAPGELTGGSMIYNGNPFTLTLRVEVIGDDVTNFADEGNYINLQILTETDDSDTMNGVVLMRGEERMYSFENAGNYNIIVVLNAYDSTNDVTLGANYSLSASTRIENIAKAPIAQYFKFENVLHEATGAFDANEYYLVYNSEAQMYEMVDVAAFEPGVTYYVLDDVQHFTYYTGFYRNFYAVAGNAAESYHYVNDGVWDQELALYYTYDATTPIVVEYSGGEFIRHHASATGFATGENGVRNAGIYHIEANVVEQENYYGWHGDIYVVIEKGVIDNLYYADRLVDGSGNPLIYSGQEYAVYVKQGSAGYNTENVAVYYPDSTQAAIAYRLEQLEAAADLTTANVTAGTATWVVDGSGNPVLLTGADAFAIDAAGYDEVGVYRVTASILGEQNYEDWTRVAYLRIVKYDTSVLWEGYDILAAQWKGLEQVTYTYNGIDQADHIRANIRLMERDADEETVSLNVLVSPTEYYATGYLLNNGNANEFRLAGDYDLGVSFEEGSISSSSRITRNYSISGATGEVTMNKYAVSVTWYLNGNDTYDPGNPPVYDSIAHNITAIGRGVRYANGFKNGVQTFTYSDIGLQTDKEQGGVWSAAAAGAYECHVLGISTTSKERIVYYRADGSHVDYDYCAYDYNYELSESNRSLTWSIAKRQLSVDVGESMEELVKYYDGLSRFEFSSSDGSNESHYSQQMDEYDLPVTISRNGQVIHVYDQVGTATVSGFVEGSNSIAYSIRGILENDIGNRFHCNKCGFIYYSTATNNYSYESGDDVINAIIASGTGWGDVPDNFECPQCKAQSAARAKALIRQLENLGYKNTEMDANIAFIRAPQIVDMLVDAYSALGNSDADIEEKYVFAMAAYNIYHLLDEDVRALCKASEVRIYTNLCDEYGAIYLMLERFRTAVEAAQTVYDAELGEDVTREQNMLYREIAGYYEMQGIIGDLQAVVSAIFATKTIDDDDYYDWEQINGSLTTMGTSLAGILAQMNNGWNTAFESYFSTHGGSGATYDALSNEEKEELRQAKMIEADTQWFLDNVLYSASINDIDRVLSLYYRWTNMTTAQKNSPEIRNVEPYVTACVRNLGNIISEMIDAIEITDDLMKFDAIVNAYDLAKAVYYYDKYYTVMYELYGAEASSYMYMFMSQPSVEKVGANRNMYEDMLNANKNPDMRMTEENVYAALINFEALHQTGLDVISEMAPYILRAMHQVIGDRYDALMAEYHIGEDDTYASYAACLAAKASDMFASEYTLADKSKRTPFLKLVVETRYLATMLTWCAALEPYDSTYYAEKFDGSLCTRIEDINEDLDDLSVTKVNVEKLLANVEYFESYMGSLYDITGARLVYDVYTAANPGDPAAIPSRFTDYEDGYFDVYNSYYINRAELNKASLSRSDVTYIVELQQAYDKASPFQKTQLDVSVLSMVLRYFGVYSIDLVRTTPDAERLVDNAKAAFYSLSPSTQAQVGYLQNLLYRVEADLVILRMQMYNRANDIRAYLRGIYAYDRYYYSNEGVQDMVIDSGVKDTWDNRSNELKDGTLVLSDVTSTIGSLYTQYETLLEISPLYFYEEVAAILVYCDMFNVTLSSDNQTKLDAMASAASTWALAYYTAIAEEDASFLTQAAITSAWSLLRIAGSGLNYYEAMYYMSDDYEDFASYVYQTSLFTEAQRTAIVDKYDELCTFIHDEAISPKSNFTADGESIDMRPQNITFKNALGIETANVSATNADVNWNDIHNDNYTIQTDIHTGTTGSTNVPAVIRPMPLVVSIGTPTTTQYYDNTTVLFEMDATNHVYTSDGTTQDPEVDGSIDSDAWTGGIANVVQRFDSAGNIIDEPRTALIFGNYFEGVVTIAGYNYQNDFVAKVKDASYDTKHRFVLRRLTDASGNPLMDEDGYYIYLRTLDAEGYSNYAVYVQMDESYEYRAEEYDSSDPSTDQGVYVPVMNGYDEYYNPNYVDYTINERPLELTYNNLLQSWQATPQDITVNSVSDPLAGTAAQDLTSSQFTALLTADGMLVAGNIPSSVIRVYNNWEDDMGIVGTYNRIDGEEDDPTAPLFVNIVNQRNRYNYAINMPVLQILYLQIQDSINYVLKVYTAMDLIKMGDDLQGLYDARHDPYAPIGKLPTINQQNDIDCIGDIGYYIMERGGALEGTYDGGNHTIRNLMLACNGLFAELDGTAGGGIIRNLNIVNAVQVSRNDTTAGILVGEMNGGTILNVAVNGYVYADRGANLSVGGVVGTATDGTLGTVSFVGRVKGYSPSNNVTAGGITGTMTLSEDLEDDANLYDNVYSFATVQARVEHVTGGTDDTVAVAGALVGSLVNEKGLAYATWATNVDFLADANTCATEQYENVETIVDETPTTVKTLTDVSYAFGTLGIGSDSTTSGGTTYDQMKANTSSAYYGGVVATRVRNYLMRDWYLGAGNYSVSSVSGRLGDTLGTEANPYAVTNYRQMQLFRWMPWLTYYLPSNSIYLPYVCVHDSEYTVHAIVTPAAYSLYSEGVNRITIQSIKGFDGTRRQANVFAKTVGAE